MKHFIQISLIITTCILLGCGRTSPPNDIKPIEKTLEVTGYCKCGKCCGWHRKWGRPVDNNTGKQKKVGITASGKTARLGTIAADTKVYPFGTIMFIEGYGYGRVEDRGGAIKGGKIDLFFRSHKQALKWGRKKIRVKIWPAKKNG